MLIASGFHMFNILKPSALLRPDGYKIADVHWKSHGPVSPITDHRSAVLPPHVAEHSSLQSPSNHGPQVSSDIIKTISGIPLLYTHFPSIYHYFSSVHHRYHHPFGNHPKVSRSHGASDGKERPCSTPRAHTFRTSRRISCGNGIGSHQQSVYISKSE